MSRVFTTEKGTREVIERETLAPSGSPFLSLYESEEGGGLINPENEEYVTFLNELYDEEFDEALSALVDEATAILRDASSHEQEDPRRRITRLNGYSTNISPRSLQRRGYVCGSGKGIQPA